MSELDRYLLRSERCLAQVRRHWAILTPEFVVVGVAWILWFVLLNLSSGELLQMVGASFFVLSSLWLIWRVFEWHRERFAVTDKRVLLVSGIITKRLAIMPLSKVTDMTYERSASGRLLGYGTFIMESAGQDQALSRVDFVRSPEELYFQLTQELFGQDDWASRDEIAPRPPSPPGRRATLRDEPRAAARWPGWARLGRGLPLGRRRRDPPSAASIAVRPADRHSGHRRESGGPTGAGPQPQVRPSPDVTSARPSAPAGTPRPARRESPNRSAAASPRQRPLPWRPRRPPQSQPGEHTTRLPQVRDPWAGPDT